MSLGTKNRLAQNATRCREHLRQTHSDQLELVNEFIVETEGPDRDASQWSKMTDLKRSESAMLERVEESFQRWLNP
ncbi:MAG: hypothetical protein RL693_1067 [Verrucomicrobiota bacterium]|jgi:hypothetical protein